MFCFYWQTICGCCYLQGKRDSIAGNMEIPHGRSPPQHPPNIRTTTVGKVYCIYVVNLCVAIDTVVFEVGLIKDTIPGYMEIPFCTLPPPHKKSHAKHISLCYLSLPHASYSVYGAGGASTMYYTQYWRVFVGGEDTQNCQEHNLITCMHVKKISVLNSEQVLLLLNHNKYCCTIILVNTGIKWHQTG